MENFLNLKNIMLASGLVAVTMLIGCTAIPSDGSRVAYKNNTSVGLSINSKTQLVYVKRKNKLFENCIPHRTGSVADTDEFVVGMRCTFASSIPDSIEFQYLAGLTNDETFAKYYGKHIIRHPGPGTDYFDLNGKKVSLDEWHKNGAQRERQAIMSLPTSAWKTYKIDLKSIMKKYKGVQPKGTPSIAGSPIPNPLKAIHRRGLTIRVDIDPNNKATMKEVYFWEGGTVENFTY